MIEVLKTAAYAFWYRDARSGLNSYDAEAWNAIKAAIKKETGEVWDGSKWVLPA